MRPRRVDHEVKRSRPSWSTRWNPVSTKNTKISWAWWCAPAVPATREAEAGELLEPRRRRLQWAEIVPLHSSLGNNSETPSQKKKKELLFLLAFKFFCICLFSLNSNFHSSCPVVFCFNPVHYRFESTLGPTTVAHAHNRSTLGGWGGQIAWRWEFETSLTNMEKPYFY